MNITDLARGVVTGIRVGGPVVLALSLLLLVVQAVSTGGRARFHLAWRSLSGGRRSWVRSLTAGALIPTLGVTALSVSISLEREVRQGPNRMVQQLTAAAPAPVFWVLQAGTDHFMDESLLPARLTSRALAEPGMAVLWEQLERVSGRREPSDTALVLGLPTGEMAGPMSPRVDPAGARCQLVAGRCLLLPGQIITDASAYRIGAVLRLRNKNFTVVAHAASDYSLINRTVIFAGLDAFQASPGHTMPSYAVVVAGRGAQQRAARLAYDSGVAGQVQVLSSPTLLANNATFWAGNGTPLIMLMIVLTAAFCGVALYGGRRSLQHRERVAIGTLRALGVSASAACQIDLLRTLKATAVSGVIAWPAAIVIIAVTDSGMIGFHAFITPLMVLAAAGVIVAAESLSTGLLLLRLRRVSVTEAIAGT